MNTALYTQMSLILLLTITLMIFILPRSFSSFDSPWVSSSAPYGGFTANVKDDGDDVLAIIWTPPDHDDITLGKSTSSSARLTPLLWTGDIYIRTMEGSSVPIRLSYLIFRCLIIYKSMRELLFLILRCLKFVGHFVSGHICMIFFLFLHITLFGCPVVDPWCCPVVDPWCIYLDTYINRVLLIVRRYLVITKSKLNCGYTGWCPVVGPSLNFVLLFWASNPRVLSCLCPYVCSYISRYGNSNLIPTVVRQLRYIGAT